MTKNPFINALAATVYIAIVASVLFYGPKNSGPGGALIIPIAMLSLFTLSAAVMGYIFLYQPLRLYAEGEKPRAVRLFLQTVAIFAVITVIALGALYARS
jgi:hypothetical protein